MRATAISNKKTMMTNIKIFQMKKLMIILTIGINACTTQVITDKDDNKNSNEQDNNTTIVQLNNGSKWKADESTKRNVAAMVQVVSDSSFTDPAKKSILSATMQSKIDSLIKQCSMKGAEHDALHVWLEKVLDDLKELKKEDDEYSETYAALKKDIESFYSFFE